MLYSKFPPETADISIKKVVKYALHILLYGKKKYKYRKLLKNNLKFADNESA